ncbi:MAG: phosphatase PAP2 family protein [Sedimentibacter sp.]
MAKIEACLPWILQDKKCVIKEKSNVMTLAIQQIDESILNFIQTGIHFFILDKIMLAFSWIGNGGAVWIVTAILLMISKKNRTTGIIVIFALVLCVIAGNVILKPLVSRMRPCFFHPEVKLLLPCPTDFSFPSGHTMSSFAAATVILVLNKKMGKWALITASLIAYSRLYLYVHYPSDIVGGIILGFAMALISIKFTQLIKNHLKI